jgi:hypothetical protein
MLGAPLELRNGLVYASACRAPLTLPLAKATWRYFHRVAGPEGIELSERSYLHTLRTVSRWAR